MKNTIWIIGLFSCFLFTACSDNNSKVEVVDEEVAVKVPTEVDLDLEGAMKAYKEGNYTDAADYITLAVDNLRTASEGLSDEAKIEVEKSIINLKGLISKVRKGQIKDMDKLELAFLEAETSIAHDYLFISSVFAIGQPGKARKALTKSIKRMENSVKRLKGKSKEEALNLIKNSKALLAKDTELADEWAEEAKAQVKKMTDWRKEHSMEIFYSSSPNMPSYYMY